MISTPKRLPRTTPQTYADKTAEKGMVSLVQPERLGPGQFQDVSNLLWDGGSLSTRPGMVGQLTSAHGAAVYVSRYRVMKANGTALIPYSTGGKVYFLQAGSTSGTEITKPGPVSFSVTSSAVRWCSVGKWLYFLDSADTSGYVWRVNLESTTVAEQVRGLTAPTTAPTIALSFKVLDTLAVANWAVDTFTGANANLCQNARFNGADATGSDLGDYWQIVAGTPKGYDSGSVSTLPALGTGEKWLRLDDPGDIVCLASNSGASTGYLANGYVENASWSSSSEYKRYCTRFLFKCRAVKTGNDAKPFLVRLQFFGAASVPSNTINPIYEVTETVTIKAQDKEELVRIFVDVSPYVAASVRYVRLYLLPDPSSTTVPQVHGPYVTDIDFQAVHPYWDKPSTPPSDAGFIPIAEEPNILAGLYVAFASSSTIVATGLDKLVLTLSTGAAFSPRPAVEFKFMDSSNNVWTSPATTFGDAIEIDIAAMPSAIKAGIKRFAMVFLEDADVISPPITRTPSSTRCAFYINDLVEPGKLEKNVAYSYLFTDFLANGTTYAEGGVESSGSLNSEALVPTNVNGRMSVTLPSGFSPAGSYFAIYRRGGSVPDGATRPRLVAIVPVGSDATGDGWTWNHTTRVFEDNVPDESLIYADVYQLSRDLVPLGATAITHHGGRLWLAKYDATYKMNFLYGSWLLDGINDFPYMSEATDPTDPDLALKGTLLRLGGQGSGDKAVAFATANLDTQGGNRGAALTVLRQQAPPAIISGNSPVNFALNPSPLYGGAGCLAPEGVENINGATVYLSANGIVASQGFNLDNLSRAIQKRLSLQAIGQSRYAQGFLVFHDERLWCIIPGSGSTDGEALVLDTRDGVQGWSRISGYSGLGFTSACSLSAGLDSGDLYLGGRDGQIYKMGGTPYSPTYTTDKATPSGTARAISWSMTSRRHGQQETQTRRTNTLNRPRALFFDINAGSAFTLTWSIGNENSHTTSGTFAHPSGRTQRSDIRELGDIRGMVHDVTLSGATVATTTLHSFLLEVSDLGSTR